MTSTHIHAGEPRQHSRPSQVRVAFFGRTATDELQVRRQYDAVDAALPGTARLVTAYIDIDGNDRGRPGREPTALLRLPVPVAGDLSNLLTDATEPGRGFDAVVSSAPDRLSHRPSERARIETALLDTGVLVLAADDPSIPLLDIGQLNSTRLAARQSKARFRARAWKEVAEDCQHGSRQALQHLLDSGWHVGPVPYGYRLEPASGVPVGGQQRHRLVPDPLRAHVVGRIFAWRQHQKLRIADIRRKLIEAPAIYPPPASPAGQSRTWSVSAIRGILLNPLYTGYRVRNRRDQNGKPTHPSQWLWPDIPAHEPLITLNTFLTVNPDAGLTLTASGGPR